VNDARAVGTLSKLELHPADHFEKEGKEIKDL